MKIGQQCVDRMELERGTNEEIGLTAPRL
ncbi:hypothetical protein DSM3645_03718 [Blastopirellula marina DSM 3645]|uniref:Uncharacterized protein n=1 Tax=Blastopirellula marina DSM 3645 TaxID=314230 RepID=A3ZW55_9BACT|nr:hypothetical protein DSM3645_03718 [Blastopirellula marina DSM 3645]